MPGRAPGPRAQEDDVKMLISAMVWPTSGPPPVAWAMEDSLDVPVAEAARQLTHEATPGSLVVADVVEVASQDEAAQVKAVAEHVRANALRWRNAAMLYQYDLDHLRLVSPTGTLSGTEPAPLSQDDVRNVLLAIARAPIWRRRTVVAYSQDGARLTLRPDGTVQVQPGAIPPRVEG